MSERRTIRRYAHEMYPHAEEGETRELAVEVPYLYARAVGLDVWGTGWYDDKTDAGRDRAGLRTVQLVAARRMALVADALLQGMAGQEAWEWADLRAWDETGEWVYERAMHYGVPVERIKPYPCGPEPDRHDHMASTGDVMGDGIITRIDCPESECPTCTEPAEPVDPRAELLAEELHNHGGCEEVWPCCSVSTVERYRNDARDLLARLDAVRADA